MDQHSETSGAAKRRRLQKLETEKAKLTKITSFFSPNININCDSDKNNPEKNDIGLIESTNIDIEHAACSQSVTIMPIPVESDDTSSNRVSSSIGCEDVSAVSSETQSVDVDNDDYFINSLINQLYPTDKGHFSNICMTDRLKMFIISQDPCQPKINFPKNTENRSFSDYYYSNTSYAGQISCRGWLCYSEKENKAYCAPCWLFSCMKSTWRDGLDDWRGLSKKIKIHEKSQPHITTCYIYDQWKQNQCIDKTLEERIRSESNYWRQVLSRLIDITLALTKNSLAFRGHKEKIDDVYNGNFLTHVNLLAKYDPILKEVINMPKGSVNYLSPTIQNEIIDCLANTLEKQLVSKIKLSPFYSIIMDTTQDITKVDQLSKIIRFVEIQKDDNNKPSGIKIIESFMGFTQVLDQSASGLTTDILNTLENLQLDLKKCRGQCYDGANVMSGIYSGVQKRIKDIESNAAYIHCAAHNLNLVINDAVREVTEVRSFFTILEDLYNFFGCSINRWDILGSFTGESSTTLKRLNPTRWAGRAQSLLAVKLRYKDIVKALTKINLTTIKKDERGETNRLLKLIENFEFIMILTICSKILQETSVASQILQERELDLSRALECLESTVRNLRQCRNNYINIKSEAVNIAKSWNIDLKFKDKRQYTPKRHHDEASTNYEFSSREYYFKVNVYYKVLDIVINQIVNRFEGMDMFVNKFKFLFPQVLITLSEEELFKSAETLQQIYCKDLSPAFPLEIVALRAPLKAKIAILKNIRDFAHFLIIENNMLASNFTEVTTALLLFLTLPVSAASAERSFSKLKIVKNYLRNSSSQQRLSSLSLLSIEAEAAANMDKDQLIKSFAEAKARKKSFLH